jgi:hypothetical protein
MKHPFCTTPPAIEAFGKWYARIENLGVELGEADDYIIGLVASREARLQELAVALAACKSARRRLQLGQAERMAAQDMSKALDLVERTYGGAGEVEKTAQAAATGTGGAHVVPFRPAGLSPTAQRIVAAVRAAPLTKSELRRRVKGAQGDFLRGIKDAIAAGELLREGAGSKARPYRYRRSEG